jgi:hypothetical protein
LDFLGWRLSPERALKAVGDVIRESPELYREFMADVRVQPTLENRSHQDDLLN